MKKIFRNLMFMALAALTFTACEDVPEPYDKPGTGTNVPGTATEIEGGAGDGTLASPFNAVSAINEAKKLASGAVSEKSYFIKGKVVSIATDKNGNVLNFDQGTFGNASFYISEDGTTENQFYCYRVLYLGNKKWAQGAGDVLKVGDEVIVYAKLTMYNTTPETQQNEGFIYSLNGKSEGGVSEDVNGEAKGDGTLENPFNAVAATNEAKKLASGAVSDKSYYIKGKVASIAVDNKTGNALNFDQGTFGNATFYISDDGTATNQFYCYRVLYLGNKKWTSGAGDILKEGDEVIVCAKLTMYNTTPETQQNEGYLYSLNGKTAEVEPAPTPGEAKGTGTLEDPFNVQAIINHVKALPADTKTDVLYVKGKVSGITSNYVANDYGNATFYISDDGTTANQFYCYRVLYLGNAKYTNGKLLKEGDEVVICGKMVNYKGNVPETQQNEAYLYMLNGTTEVTEGDDPTPEPVVTGDVTKSVEGNTLTLTNTKVTASANTISVDFNAQGWTNAQEITELTLSDGTKITFAKGEGSNAPKFYDATKGMRLYAKNSMAVIGIKPIAKLVIECDNYQGTPNVGNTTLYGTIDGNTMTIINEHSSATGGVQFRPKTMTITYAE